MKGGVLRGEVLRRGSAEKSVGVGAPTRLWCPQGTVRIQRRMRAVSATVPKTCAEVFYIQNLQHDSKYDTKITMVQTKMSQMGPTLSQHGQR